jgi:hypothetical protein
MKLRQKQNMKKAQDDALDVVLMVLLSDVIICTYVGNVLEK